MNESGLNDEGIGGDENRGQEIALGSISKLGHNNWSAIRDLSGTINMSIQSSTRYFGRLIFGDKHGLALFSAAIAFYMLYLRIGFFINDNYAIANALVAVSEGHLHVERAVYGPGLDTPGMYADNGIAYARNYGQIILALPFLWAIQGVAAVADLRVALAGGWALLVLGLFVLSGELLDRDVFGRDSREVATYAGSAIAVLAFLLIIRGASPIDPVWHHLLALQAQAMVAAGLLGVTMYRMVNRMYSRRIGLFAGATVVFVTPIGFWASLPKRHVLVACGVAVSAYCLYRSREAISGEGTGQVWCSKVFGWSLTVSEFTCFRSMAYVPVGFVAWVNPLEGIILLAALLAVDVPTGGWRVRSLMTAGCTGLLSCVPMFVTNVRITGNPLEPPTALDFYGSNGLAGQRVGGGGGRSGGASAGGGGGASAGGDGGAATSPISDSVVGVVTVAENYLSNGISVVTTEFDTLFYVFIRSGYIDNTIQGGDAWRLSFIEAMPLAAVLVMIPILVWRINVLQHLVRILKARRLSPVSTIDAFVGVYSLFAILVFLPRFPMNAEIPVRYLLVLFPLTAYGIVRLSSVRRVLNQRYQTCVGVYLSGVLVGGQILFLLFYITESSLSESIQVHAYIGLILAVPVAGWALADGFGRQNDPVGAIVLSLSAAAGTVFVLLSRLWHFGFSGSLVLPFI